MMLVVTATLGESRFLEQTVASVASLKLKKRHVLIVPARAAESLGRRFNGCEIVCETGGRSGLYQALNTGLQKVGGDWNWFTCINDDDVIGNDFERVARAHVGGGEHRRVAYGDVTILFESGRAQGQISVEKRPCRFVALLHAGVNPLSHPGMIFSRQVIDECGGFDDRLRVCGDLDFWLKSYKSGYSFVHYAGEVAGFRLRQGQISSCAGSRVEMRAIIRRYFPESPTAVEKFGALFRFRLANAPRRFRRVFSTGWRSNAALLAHGGREIQGVINRSPDAP